jgi:hypothetical protein
MIWGADFPTNKRIHLILALAQIETLMTCLKRGAAARHGYMRRQVDEKGL